MTKPEIEAKIKELSKLKGFAFDRFLTRKLEMFKDKI